MLEPSTERQITITLPERYASALDAYVAINKIGFVAAVQDLVMMGLEPFFSIPKLTFPYYSNVPVTTQNRQHAFLGHLQTGVSHEEACQLTGIAIATPYNWARQNRRFWYQWQEAKEEKARLKRVSVAKQLRGQAELLEQEPTQPLSRMERLLEEAKQKGILFGAPQGIRPDSAFVIAQEE